MTVEIADIITPGHEGAFKVGTRNATPSLRELPEVHRRLFDEAVTACLATITPSGHAQLTPVWVNTDGDHLFLNSTAGRDKDRNLRARPDVTLMLLNPKNPYHWLTVYGRVVEVIDETTPNGATSRPRTSTISPRSTWASGRIRCATRPVRSASATPSSRDGW